jgi:hypothetical protein
LNEAVPAGWHRDPDAFAGELRGRLAEAGQRLANLDARALARTRADRFLSTRAPLLHGVLADLLGAGAIDDRTVVGRRRGSVCEIRPAGDRIDVLLGDRRIRMPAWLEPALRRVAAAPRFAVGELAPEVRDADSRAVLVRRLVREGLLRLERAPVDG